MLDPKVSRRTKREEKKKKSQFCWRLNEQRYVSVCDKGNTNASGVRPVGRGRPEGRSALPLQAQPRERLQPGSEGGRAGVSGRPRGTGGDAAGAGGDGAGERPPGPGLTGLDADTWPRERRSAAGLAPAPRGEREGEGYAPR